MPKGGSIPPATEIAKLPLVPQAQERKPQVAYKTEIIGGVVVHTPISINQVSRQDPRTVPDPGLKSLRHQHPRGSRCPPGFKSSSPWG